MGSASAEQKECPTEVGPTGEGAQRQELVSYSLGQRATSAVGSVAVNSSNVGFLTVGSALAEQLAFFI